MKQRLFLCFLAGGLALLTLACRASSSADSVPCVCGTPQADIDGCGHADCVNGKTNPDNPDCVCGTLSIPK